MTMNFPDDLPPVAVELMQAHLAPGETILCGMPLMAEIDGSWEIYVITDRRVHHFRFKRQLLGRPIVAAARKIELDDINDSSYHLDGNLWTGKKACLELQLTGGERRRLLSQDLTNAVRFLNALRDAQDRADRSRSSLTRFADELTKLAELKGQGLLSEDDWERAKDLFLGKQSDEKQSTLDDLRSLHALYKAGVLSESEFNSKKWDVLSRH